MLTPCETRKLRDEMAREPEEPAYTLWKCVAGLCFVVALALIGAGWPSVPEGAAYAASPPGR